MITTSPRRRVVRLAAAFAVVAATLGLPATPAAAGIPTLDHTVSIEFSGTAPFADDGDGEVGPGEDVSGGVDDGFAGIKHYARTGDRTSFKLEYNVNGEDADRLTLKARLVEVDAAGVPTGNPIRAGVTFPELPVACQAGSSLAADGHSFTCEIGAVPSGTTAFVPAQVEADNTIPNGYHYAIQYEVCELADDGSVEVQTGEQLSESVTATAAPRYDLWKRRAYNRGPVPMPADGPGTEGDIGVVVQYALGVLAGDGDSRGLSMLAEYDQDLNGNSTIDDEVSFTDDIAPIAGGPPFGTPPGSYLYDFGYFGDGCGSNYGTDARGESNVWGDQPRGQIGHDGGTIDNATPDSGVWTCSQTGTDIDITITGADFRGRSYPTTTASNSAMSADQKWFASGWVAVWIPIEAIENGPDGLAGTADDGEYPSSDELSPFDPDDIWGQSNYGAGTEPLVDDADQGWRQNELAYTLVEGGIGWDKDFRHSLPGGNAPGIGWSEAPTNGTAVNSGDGQAMNGTQFSSYLRTTNRSFRSRSAYQVCDAFDNSTFTVGPDRNGFIWAGWFNGTSVDAAYPTDLNAYDTGFSGSTVNPDQYIVVEFGTGVNGGVAGNWADGNLAVPSDPSGWGIDSWQRPGWDLMENATCGDADSADGWFELPNPYDPADLPTGVTLADITKFRVRIVHPDADPAGTWDERSVLPAGQDVLMAINHIALDNEMYNNSVDSTDPRSTILANMAGDSYTNKDGSIFTRTVGYDPLDNSSTATGDRLIATLAQVRIDKEFVEKVAGSGPNFLGGDPVTWTLQPTVASLTDLPADPAEDVRVVDEFPQPYLEYLPGSASPASFTDLTSGAVYPVQFCIVAGCDKDTPAHWTATEPADPAAVLGLMWDFGEVPLGAVLPLLSYDTQIAIDAPNNETIPNVATIHSPSDQASEERRSDDTSIKVIQLGALSVRKDVSTPIIFTDEAFTYTLRFANVSAADIDSYDLIDVLPHNDQDTASTPYDFPSDYTGSLVLTGVTADAGNVAHVVYYSATDPATIQQAANDATNTIPGGATVWCSDDAGAIAGTPALGTAGCPAGDLSDATAFRIIGETLVGPPTPSGVQTFTVDVQTVDNTPIDFYANEFDVKLPDSVLQLPVKSNEVYTRVWGGTIGDLVFDDLDRDGVYTDGTDVGIEGVDLELLDGGVVIDTATTDADGRYVFDFIERPGDYEVRIVASNTGNGEDLEFYLPTVSPEADPNTDLDEDDDHHAGAFEPTGEVLSGAVTLGVGTEPVGEDHNGTDTSGAVDNDANVTVDFGFWKPTPDIEISKLVEDPDNPDTYIEVIEVGPTATVEFQIRVENTGEVDLTGVVVTDPDLAACDNTIGALAIDEVVTYTCSGTVTADMAPNTASVMGNPDDGQPTVTDSDDATAGIVDLDIVKEFVHPDTGEWVGSAEAPLDATVPFRITVTNTGTVEAHKVEIADPDFPQCNASTTDLGVGPVTPLAPGDSVSTTCDIVASALIDNTATATIGGPGGVENGESDDAYVNTYGIDLAKTVTDPETGDPVELVEVGVGDTVEFTFVISNLGSAPITGVELSDDRYPSCDTTIATIAAESSVSHTCEVVVTDSLVNTGSVTATSAGGHVLTDDDTAAVEARGLILVKEVWDATTETWAETTQVIDGADVTYRFTLTNVGDTTLTGLTVTDADVAACSSATLGETIPDLAPDASHAYECTVTHTGGDLTNTASAAGVDGSGNDVGDDDTAAVDEVAPAITLVKEILDPATGTYVAADAVADAPVFAEGDTASFRITVTNSGDVELLAVTISDPLVAGCATTIASLAPGASETVECEIDLTDDLTNTASVTADPACADCGDAVTDDDEASADVDPGSISGTVFDDDDGDGTQDGGEDGVSGVTVVLLDDEGNEIARTTTGTDGSYEFENLPPGDYTIEYTGGPTGVTLPPSGAATVNGGTETEIEGAAALATPTTTTGSGTSPDTLAFTGAESSSVLVVAATLLTAGFALLLVGGRRRRTE